jgi:hypothetical protein
MSNLILMTIWTVLNPLGLMRTDTSPTETYWACKMQDTDSASWKVIISVFAMELHSSVPVSKPTARNVDTEFGE